MSYFPFTYDSRRLLEEAEHKKKQLEEQLEDAARKNRQDDYEYAEQQYRHDQQIRKVRDEIGNEVVEANNTIWELQDEIVYLKLCIKFGIIINAEGVP